MPSETDHSSVAHNDGLDEGDIITGDIVNSKAVAVGLHSKAIYVVNVTHIHNYPADIQQQTTYETDFAIRHGSPVETSETLHTSLQPSALESASAYEDVPLQLDSLEEFVWCYPSPYVPKGWVNLGGTAFQLQEKDGRAAGWAVRPSPQNEPRVISIPVGLENVSTVLMLITAGWGLKRIEGLADGWEGEQIGVVQLCFKDADPQEQPLILGDNIRDWAIGNTEWAVAETTDPNVFPVWISPGGGSAIDLLRIDVEGGPKTLEKIEILAQMVSLKGQALRPVELREGDKQLAPPSFAIIQISGITCRVHPSGSGQVIDES
jgi:hypothetical protein